jgi:hypothetical protein
MLRIVHGASLALALTLALTLTLTLRNCRMGVAVRLSSFACAAP